MAEQEDYISDRTRMIDKIFNSDYPTLNIGKNTGSAGYLDFITQKQVIHNVVKGFDSVNRNFFVIKAEFVYENGEKVKTFTTFFKRYANKDSYSWFACGHYGKIMMETSGGMSDTQFEFISQLLDTGEIILNEQLIDDIRLTCKGYNDIFLPISLKLGYTN